MATRPEHLERIAIPSRGHVFGGPETFRSPKT